MPIFDAAMKYKSEGVPLLIPRRGGIRHWQQSRLGRKGPHLLGVRAVIASSFERIHRSNLVGMGILPLQLPTGQSWESLGLTGEEVFDIDGLSEAMRPGCELTVHATAADGAAREFRVKVRIDTPVELEYYRKRRHPANRAAESWPTGRTATEKRRKNRPSANRGVELHSPGELFADDFQVGVIVANGLFRIEIEDRPAIGHPMVAIEAEDGPCRLEDCRPRRLNRRDVILRPSSLARVIATNAESSPVVRLRT